MSYPSIAGTVACFKCRKVYAVITADGERGGKHVELIEPFTFADGSTPISPFLRCTCGFLTPIERGLVPHPASSRIWAGNVFQSAA